MYCSNCGSSIPENSRFCSSCGTSLNVNTRDEDDFVKLKTEAKWVNGIDESSITETKMSLASETPEDIQYFECNGIPNLGLCIKKVNGCTVYYYVNIDGEVLSNQYDYASQDFTCGLAIVKFGGLYGMVNTNLEKVVATAYSELEVIEIKNSPSYYLVKAKKNGYYGCIDLTGKITFQFIYQEIGKFRNGIVGVKLNGKYNFVDSKCNDVFPFYWTDYPEILGNKAVSFTHNGERFQFDGEGRLFLNVLVTKQIEEAYPITNLLYYTSALLISLSGISIIGIVSSVYNNEEMPYLLNTFKYIFFPTALIIVLTYCISKMSRKRDVSVWEWSETSLNYIK
jgi:hypothetical protein